MRRHAKVLLLLTAPLALGCQQQAARTVEGTAGDGAVKAQVSEKMEVVSLQIDPKLLAKGDPNLLDRMVATAVNKGLAKAKSKGAEPAVTVTAPITDEVMDYEDFTGQTMAMFSVDVRARVTGYLDKVYFEDGTEVEEGAPLFLIDPRPYKADYDRSEATLAQSEAHLKRLEADYRRVSNLYNRGNVSREEFDRAAGDRAEAEAAVGVARATRDLAKLNLEYTKIIAPIAGRLSRRMVDPGNLVKQDDTIMTSIVSLDPMFVYFDIDEPTVLRLRRLVKEGKIKSRQEAEISVLGALSDEEGFPHVGKINFSENKVDPNTGTLRVRGLIANPRVRGGTRVLSPGMYMKVRLPVGNPRQAILVPEQSVGTDQGRKFIYLVETKSPGDNVGKVVERTVQVGALNGEYRVIESGVSREERVVYHGLQRIRPGATVKFSMDKTLKKPSAPAPKEEAKPAAATPVADTGARPAESPASAPVAGMDPGPKAQGTNAAGSQPR